MTLVVFVGQWLSRVPNAKDPLFDSERELFLFRFMRNFSFSTHSMKKTLKFNFRTTVPCFKSFFTRTRLKLDRLLKCHVLTAAILTVALE